VSVGNASVLSYYFRHGGPTLYVNDSSFLTSLALTSAGRVWQINVSGYLLKGFSRLFASGKCDCYSLTSNDNLSQGKIVICDDRRTALLFANSESFFEFMTLIFFLILKSFCQF